MQTPAQVRDVVNVTFRRAVPEAEPLRVGAQFWTLRDRVVAGEQDVLRALGFSGESPLGAYRREAAALQGVPGGA